MKTTNECNIIIVSDFKEGLAIAKKEVDEKNLYGFVDETLNETIPFEFEAAFSFKNGKAYVKKDNEFFFIDKQGNVIETEKKKILKLS